MSSTGPRILLLEDEQTIADALIINLEHEGYHVVHKTNGPEALSTLESQFFDLAILDIMVPDLSGIEVAEKLKLMHEEVPFLFISARDQPSDIINGLKLGAEDYIKKPFYLEEVLLRIKKAVNRSKKQSSNTQEQFSFGNFWINFKEYKASGIHGEFELSQKEAMLLKLLVQHKNHTVSRKEILTQVWGYDVFPTTRTIDNFIANFRRHFEENSRKPIYFKSVRGIGYRFELDE